MDPLDPLVDRGLSRNPENTKFTRMALYKFKGTLMFA